MSYRAVTSATAAMPTTLAGPRFALRRPIAGDAEPLGRLVGDPERAGGVVDGWVRHWQDEGFGPWVIDGDEGDLLGFVGIRRRDDDIAVTVRSSAEAAADGRTAAALRRAVAHGIEWYPDLPLRLRVAADDATTRGVAELCGLVHVPEDDHEARGVQWRVMESPYIRTFTQVPPAARDSVLDLWMRVNDAGGSVGFLPGAPREEVDAALTRYESALAEGSVTGVALMSPVGGVLGIGFLRRAHNALMAHARTAEVVMVDPDWRGRGVGRQLMGALHQIAREHGVELVVLDYRDGQGLGDFYAKVGYAEVGRVPGLIRVAADDDRDGVTVARRLDR